MRLSFAFKGAEMKSPMDVAALQEKLGFVSGETVEGLRLLKAFLRLSPRQRLDVVEFIEHLAVDPAAPWEG
jgi:hypothetical protein